MNKIKSATPAGLKKNGIKGTIPKDFKKSKQQLVGELANYRQRLAWYEALDTLGEFSQQRMLIRLFESDLIGILLSDVEKILYANDALLRIIGYTRKDLFTENISWRGMTPYEYHDLDVWAFQQLTDNHCCPPYAKEYYRKDGSRVPIIIGATLIEAEPMRWVCFVLDNSENTNAQAELKKYQTDLEKLVKQRTVELEDANRQVVSILESFTDAFYALDNQWRFTYVNKEAESLLMRRREDLVGQDLRHIFPLTVGTPMFSYFSRAMTEKVTLSFETMDVYTEVWGEVSVYPSKDGITVYFKDITAKK
ncbi:MAG: PAS domain-containing protein [Bacillota bacterium]